MDMTWFLDEAKTYKQARDNDIFKNWLRYTGYYLSIMKDIPREEAEAFLKWGLKNNKLPYHDPIVHLFRKDELRDRYRDTMRFSQFTKEIRDRGLIMAPTLTCYLPKDIMKSELADFTWYRFQERKRIKKEGQIAKSYGRIQEAIDKGNQQNNKKTIINSISGALTIESTPIANRSGHSTLTSTCRTATAFANAVAERMLAGRRYFPDGQSVLESIVTILSDVNEQDYQQVMDKFNLHYITPEELMQALHYSYDSYWRSKHWDDVIWSFVSKLTPLQCSIYLYMGDFYHLREYNPEFVSKIISETRSYKNQPTLQGTDTDAELASMDAYYVMFVTSMVADKIGSKSIYAPEHKDQGYYPLIGTYSKYAKEVFSRYADYFSLFWKTKFVPGETALFPHVIRKAVLGGDTDSTLYTIINWVRWYHKQTKVTDDTKVTAQLITYWYCSQVRHALALTSGQIGVDEKEIFLLEMKNEYYFDTFSPSNRTKHYINTKSACEGINYKEKELEAKGVALKNSKAHVDVMHYFQELIMRIMDDISKDEKIIIKDFITDVARIEAKIFESAMYGGIDYLPTRMIKVKEAYTVPMSSDYANHELWEDVFAPKYGHAPEPPYEGIRISMNLPNPTAIKGWLYSLKDQAIVERMQQFLDKHNRKGIASIILPYETVAQAGIPDELKPIINVRKIIFANTEPYYILGEMLGDYRVNKWLTKMFLDDRLDLIPPHLVKFFDGSEDIDLATIRKQAMRDGVQYETWDQEQSDEDLDDEDNQKSTEEDDEEQQEDV